MKTDIFLKKYWQKKPLFIKGALKDFAAPLSKKELQKLAKSSDLESRLISSDKNRKKWEVHYGPFRSEDLQPHSEGKSTLLVQGVENVSEQLKELLFSIKFLPRWRLADVMVSDGGPQSSVGPHYDSYDVFLVQLKGEKLWKIGQQLKTRPKLLNNCDLRILAQPKELFTDEYLASPGDVLYLPPMVPHYGVGQNDNQTYSIGFLAPAHQEIINDYFGSLAEHIDSDLRFQDPSRRNVENPAELDEASIEQFIKIIKQYTPNPDQIKDWLGRFLTQNDLIDFKSNSKIHASNKSISTSLLKAKSLSFAPGLRAYYSKKKETICIYLAGNIYTYNYTKGNLTAVKTLCEQNSFRLKELKACHATKILLKDFESWCESGLIL